MDTGDKIIYSESAVLIPKTLLTADQKVTVNKQQIFDFLFSTTK